MHKCVAEAGVEDADLCAMITGGWGLSGNTRYLGLREAVQKGSVGAGFPTF